MKTMGQNTSGNIEPIAAPATPAAIEPDLANGTAAGGDRDITLATAIGQVAEGVVITDAQARIQYVNQSFTRLTGYAAEEVIGQNPRVLKAGRHDAEFYKELWRTIQSGKVWHGELINRRKDGSEYTEEMSITPVRNSGGSITNYIAIKQDVTARRAAENAQRFLAAVVESSPDAILRHTPEGIITSWSCGAERMFGYPAQKIIGKSVATLIPPEMPGLFSEAMERLRESGAISNLECAGVRENGARIDVSLSMYPIQDHPGRLVAVAAFIRDITAHKRAAEALRQSEEQFRTAFADAPFGMCLTALDGHYLQVNAAFCRMLGYSERELLEGAWQNVTHPEDLEVSRQNVEQLVRRLVPSGELEKRYIHKSG